MKLSQSILGSELYVNARIWGLLLNYSENHITQMFGKLVITLDRDDISEELNIQRKHYK